MREISCASVCCNSVRSFAMGVAGAVISSPGYILSKCYFSNNLFKVGSYMMCCPNLDTLNNYSRTTGANKDFTGHMELQNHPR